MNGKKRIGLCTTQSGTLLKEIPVACFSSYHFKIDGRLSGRARVLTSNATVDQLKFSCFQCLDEFGVGVADAAAVPAEAAKEGGGFNPIGQWIDFIRRSVLAINQFYKGE